MTRDARYDVLFEPVQLGPVTAKNRFYQVPHCNGMGYMYPNTWLAMRAEKAEGGWGVVCTEQAEIHYSSEGYQDTEVRIWDELDTPLLARMCEMVHEHGALAGIELTHNGMGEANHYSREVPMGPAHLPVRYDHSVQARAMDKADIKALRRWHRSAALRAKEAGFDIVYCYSGEDDPIAAHFISPRYNTRTDEYGGSLENRARLLKELIADTKDAVGDTCAVAVRLSIDELLGPIGLEAHSEAKEIVEILADLPDLWDFNLATFANDAGPSRFFNEGYQEDYVRHCRAVTQKPVVGVGRFTSPDTMVSQIKRGVLDMIGAVRPSIADPFLPKKIEEGRPDDIRECIGCNICVAHNQIGVPMRCTQNAAQGERFRRGWHPEIFPAKDTDDSFLIVGGGPAGLEAARVLGERGYAVTLAEASENLGGRVTRETAAFPGLAAWARVRDYRTYQIGRMADVAVYPASALTADDVLGFGATRVAIATGSRWRGDGVGHTAFRPLPGSDLPHVLTPDAIMDGALPDGPVLVYDDDHYYMGGVIAERLADAGREVTLVTPEDMVANWAERTLEQGFIQTRLLEKDVRLVTAHALSAIADGEVTLSCAYTGRERQHEAASVVLVTARLPEDGLYHALVADPGKLADAGIVDVTRIGDCFGPATIANAVHAGHRYGRELTWSWQDEAPFRRETPSPYSL